MAAKAERVEREGARIVLGGDLSIDDAGALLRAARAAAREGEKAIEVDFSGAGDVPGTVVALAVELKQELGARRVGVELTGLGERVKPLVELYTAKGDGAPLRRRRAPSMVTQVGDATASAGEEARSILDFVGQMVLAAGRLLRSPRSGHWKEVPALIEKTGADAVPIALVINGLVGFVMAYQSMRQLQTYGANVYVADLVGISVTRELAPLMTAIVVTGRSGAAFAAEIGSMKVAEEIDALRTLGLRPFEWLVVPRIIALAIVTPLLTAIADVVGIAGGCLVAVESLGISAQGYLNEAKTAVVPADIESGLIKSFVFGITIALIGCQQGFSASGGAEGVGKRTTATVVTCLFAIVVLDTLCTLVFRSVGLLP